MSLTHVLLTSLLEKPSTGIDLARRFDRSMGFFWNATHQQIYRELGTMLKKGWISTLNVENTDSRKKTYQVEHEGKIELQHWILGQTQPHKLRDELMVKLRAEAQLGQETIMPELERHKSLHQAQLTLYQEIYQKDQLKQLSSDERSFAIQQKILELGIQFEHGWITWLDGIMELLQHYKNN